MMSKTIRKNKRTHITEHVYTADGRKKEPHPNPLPRRGNSIISSHLPLGEIREGYSTIQQNTNYYPYGGMTSISTGQGEQQFKYNGKEYDPMHGLNEYDYGAPSDEPLFFTSCKMVICDFVICDFCDL